MAGQQTRGARRSEYVDNGGASTTRDLADARRARRDRDAPIERAYKAGHAGDDPAEFQTDDRLHQHYLDGQQARQDEDRLAARDERSASRRATVGAAGARAGSVANDGAGIILGLFAYALLVNYLQGGIAGTKAWLSAKFLNRPTGAAAKARTPTKAATPTAPSKPGAA